MHEVRVLTHGKVHRLQLVTDEIEANTANDPKGSTQQLILRKRKKRRTTSNFEKGFYRKYGKRFHEGSAGCRNDILNEILDYQKSHPALDWRITDRIGIYNHLFNNYERKSNDLFCLLVYDNKHKYYLILHKYL